MKCNDAYFKGLCLKRLLVINARLCFYLKYFRYVHITIYVSQVIQPIFVPPEWNHLNNLYQGYLMVVNKSFALSKKGEKKLHFTCHMQYLKELRFKWLYCIPNDYFRTLFPMFKKSYFKATF